MCYNFPTLHGVGSTKRSLRAKLVLKTTHISRLQTTKKCSLMAVLVLSASLMSVSTSAVAQDKGTLETQSKIVTPTDGLNLNLSNNSIGSSLNILDLPAESVGSTLFKLDLADTGCLTGNDGCLSRTETLDLGYSKAFTSRSRKGLDLSLTPRAALRFNDESSSAVVGAVVEIGEDLRKGSDLDNNTWYFFAGADAEALTYSPNSVGRLTSGQFHLQDRIIVGDAQAGLGYRIGDADVSLSYLRREASAEDYSFKEDAAALSFTWKR